MTREDQIQHATAAYQAKLLIQGYNPVASDNCADGFYDGVCWADSTPNWHLCKDELPCAKIGRYICTDGHDVFIAVWRDDTPDGLSGWELFGMYKEPTAWMELPEPPK